MRLKALLLLASAALVLAQDAVVSKGLFLGEDTSDKDANGSEIFTLPANHPTAVASILKLAAEKSSFNPHLDGPVKSINSFASFTDKWHRLPGIRLASDAPVKSLLVLGGGRNSFYRAVLHSDLRDDENREAIAEALTRLVPDTNEDKSLKEWTLFLAVIKKKQQEQKEGSNPSPCSLPHEREEEDILFTPDDEVPKDESNKVAVDLITLTLELKTNTRNGNRVELGEQTAILYVYRLEADTQRLIEGAETYAKYIRKVSIANFERFFSSKHSTTPGKTMSQWLGVAKKFFNQVPSLWL